LKSRREEKEKPWNEGEKIFYLAFFGAHTKHITTKLITTKLIFSKLISDKTQHKTYQTTKLINYKTYQTTKQIKLQNISKLKLINKIHESKFSNHGNVPTIV